MNAHQSIWPPANLKNYPIYGNQWRRKMPLLKFDKAEMMGWLAEVIQSGLDDLDYKPPFLDEEPLPLRADVDPTGYVAVTLGEITFYVDIVSKFE